jgi:exonuclease III
MLLINSFAPTEDDIKNKFYNDLDLLCDTLPVDKPRIVLGDYNEKIEKENIYNPTMDPKSYMKLRTTMDTN